MKAEPRRRSLSVLLSVDGLAKYYEAPAGLTSLARGRRGQVKAVDGVSFEISPGQTLGLVGESGCGKTTTARCIVGLTESTAGKISLNDCDITKPIGQRGTGLLNQIQMVFQNPDSTLNPTQTVSYIIDRTIRVLQGGDGDWRKGRVLELLEAVGLDESYADRYPRQLSGGEKQRVAIARAFSGQPDLIICDEPLSSLDVSVQASILNLLSGLQCALGTSYLFISHDLSVVRYLADHIGVFYMGRLCEIGSSEAVFSTPHPQTTQGYLSSL